MNMVEKMARAIMMARPNGGCNVVDWEREGQENPHVEQAIKSARAVLTALSEPTEEMIAAALETNSRFGKSAMANIWQAMLAAASKD